MQTEELKELMGEVALLWPEGVPPKVTRYIDENIMRGLRGMDYFAKQKLMLLLTALRMEQFDDRPESKKAKVRPLHYLVSIIDQIEKDIAEEKFNQQLTDAVWGLPRDKQRELLDNLEGKEAQP